MAVCSHTAYAPRRGRNPEQPVRIARILTRLNLGGPARQVLASDPLLAERGHELRVFAGAPEKGEGDLFEELSARGIDTVRVPGMGRGIAPLRDLRALRFLGRELRAFGPDIVHTHASKAGALGRRAARKLSCGIVHTFHGHVLEGYYGEAMSAMLVSQERRMAGLTDRVIAVSHRTAEDLLRLEIVDEARLVVVPPGIELTPFLELDRRAPRPGNALRSELALGEDDFLLGVVGRFAPIKRLEWAVEVFEKLALRHPRLHLCFVGDGEARAEFEAALSRLDADLRRRVHRVGPRTDMPPVMHALDALLSTSRSEGMPVSIIEAAAAAIPTVATPVGGVPEVIATERTGFLGETPDELAFGVDQLLANREECLAMGHRARLRIEKRHGARHLADRLEELYEVVVEERRCAS